MQLSNLQIADIIALSFWRSGIQEEILDVSTQSLPCDCSQAMGFGYII